MVSISEAASRNCRPSSVRDTALLVRTNSGRPSSSSSSCILRETVGWDRCRRPAAFVIFPSYAVLIKISSLNISILLSSSFPE
jgi:hypothetical protein